MIQTTINHGHLFCGLGGGARGFNRSAARVGLRTALMRCVGGIDVDRGACDDFHRLTGVPATCLDLASRAQYIAINGREPPDGWREAVPADIRAAMLARPHIWFLSAPCKGFSGLTSETKSLSPKYQALNELTLRGIWLALEAYADDPVEFIVFENVPRIMSRGRWLLDQIVALLKHYGYAVAETTHDCGKLGGLAQSRKRFLLVARHTEKVPPFLYEPRMKRLRGVGEVLGKLPMPGDPRAGALHRVPNLEWKTWVRLAFVEAGKDWRSLNRLAIDDGILRDYGIVSAHSGAFGVRQWGEYTGTVAGESLPSNGAFSVADPRVDGHHKSVQMGVRPWDQAAGVITGKMFVGGGPNAVADPRVDGVHHNVYRVVRWDAPGPTVTGNMRPTCGGGVADPRPAWENRHGSNLRVGEWEEPAGVIHGGGKGPQGGAQSVADPRMSSWNDDAHRAKLRVTEWEAPNFAITGARGPYSGAVSVADPRPGLQRERGDDYLTSGHYGVVPWHQPSGAVASSMQHDNGRGSVADPRLPALDDKLACVILAEDGTWHRPFTTLDMGALQSLFDPEEFMHFQLQGSSDSAWRERIGNAVPSDAAAAIGSEIARTLLLSWSGETFVLSNEPIWVRQQIAAIQCGSSS